MLFNKFLIICTAMSLVVAQTIFAQETEQTPQTLSKKEVRLLKKSFKRLSNRILSSEELSREYFDLINSCKDDDFECQIKMDKIAQSTLQGTNLEAQANGMMFGICKPQSTSRKAHQLIFSKRQYDCKLSSHGKVYDRHVERKLYGPGLWWEKQTIVLFCTGATYGKTMTGFTVAAGAFFGITATTMVGKAGVCLAVGAGKSAGIFVGADRYSYESLEDN